MDQSPEEIIQIIRNNLTSRYANVATLALLLYEYSLTFEDERRLIWPIKWSITKLIYVANRYTPFVGISGLVYVLLGFPVHHSIKCKPPFLIACGFIFFSYVIAEFILYLRAYAVWGCTRRMFIFCAVALTAIYTTMLYFTIRFISLLTVSNDYPSILHSGCIPLSHGLWDVKSFIILICSETVALVLLVSKAGRLSQSRIMRTLFRDGVLYFMLIILASIGNLVILLHTSPTLNSFLLPMQGLLHSIFCNRLLLSIKKSATGESPSTAVALTTDMQMETYPGIQFESMPQFTVDTVGEP